MKFSSCQVFLIVAISSVSGLKLDKIAEGIDSIFLSGNITAEESRSILAEARESYQTLTDYNNETDPERKKVLMVKVRAFASQVVDDLAQPEMTIQRLFNNINSYLKGVGLKELETDEPLTIPLVIGLLTRKLAQHQTQTINYDVKRILSGSGDEIIRGSDDISPTTIGYFFLEAFATILGLSWGIISMILSDFQ